MRLLAMEKQIGPIRSWRSLLPAIFAIWLGTSSAVFGSVFDRSFQAQATVLNRDGSYYGGATSAGPFRGGSIYALSPVNRGRFVAAFPAQYGSVVLPFGFDPEGTLGTGPDGALYVSARSGGAFGSGVLYKVTPAGRLTMLHHYEAPGPDSGAVYCGSDGTIYSARAGGGLVILSKDGRVRQLPGHGSTWSIVETAQGEIWIGSYYSIWNGNVFFTNMGEIQRLNAQGELEHLADVEHYPHTPLPLADGSVILLTDRKIVQVQPSGTVTMLHQFSLQSEGVGPNAIFADKDGAFIGTTDYGGSENGGVIFRLVPGTNEYSVLQSLHNDPLNGYSHEWRKQVFPLRAAAETGNRPPMARDDVVAAALIEAAAHKTGVPHVEVRVLANDADADGDPLTITAVTTPANGTATIAPGGKTIDYQAASATVANDSFLYTISDSLGGTATARVAIGMNPAGRYRGNVTSDVDPVSGDPGTLSGSIALHVSNRRLVAGRLVLLGHTFTFSGQFNEVNQLARVLLRDDRGGRSTALQLTLQPEPTGYSVKAHIREGYKWFHAPSTLVPGSN